MPDNDYTLLWEASKFDWNEIKKRFQDKLPNRDMQRVNRQMNINFPIFTLLINLNNRVEELEFELKSLGGENEK